jgi:hypothetical protein
MPAVLQQARIRMLAEAILESGVTGVSGGDAMRALDEEIRLTDGTGDGQADRVYYAVRSLGAGLNETLDLAGVLEDLFGNVLTFAKVKFVGVKNVNTAAGNLEFGPNGANGAGVTSGAPWKAAANKTPIPINSGFFSHYNPAGWTVTAGTGDLLYAENMSGVNTVTYRVLIIGTSV